MTLAEMLHATGRALNKHDYEFLVGDDGLAHLVIVADVMWPRGADQPTFSFFCPCGAFNGKEVTIERREIATGITCIACNTR